MKRIILITAIVAALVLTACGRAAKSSSENTSANTPQQVSGEAPKPQPQEPANKGAQDGIEAYALYTGLIDNHSAEMRLIDSELDNPAFELSDEVKEYINKNKLKAGSLVFIKFSAPGNGGNPVVTSMEKKDGIKFKAKFNGLADERIGEFEVYKKIWTFEISQGLQEKFGEMESNTEVMISVKPNRNPGANLLITGLEK